MSENPMYGDAEEALWVCMAQSELNIASGKTSAARKERAI